MSLDARLRRLAQGMSAADAARAHAKSQRGEELVDAERSQAAEFESTLELMFLMAAVDGDISDEEVEQLAASFQAVVDLQQVQGIDLQQLLERFNARLTEEGWRERLHAACANIENDEARSFAFRLAAGVAFVDDHVAHAEAAAIEALAAAFAISADESQAILKEVADELFGG